jgi:hypothetical protein
MYSFSENKGRRKSSRLNSKTLLRTWTPLVQTQLNFTMRLNTAFVSLPSETLNFLYWPVSGERCSRVYWSLTLSGSYLPHFWSRRGRRKGQWTCSECCQSTSPLSSSHTPTRSNMTNARTLSALLILEATSGLYNSVYFVFVWNWTLDLKAQDRLRVFCNAILNIWVLERKGKLLYWGKSLISNC